MKFKSHEASMGFNNLKKGVEHIVKINQTVRRETAYIAVWVLLLSALMQAVFLILRMWNIGVLLGNVLTGAISIFNFLLLGVTVQKAVEREEKDAKSLMKLSQTLRMLMIFVALVIVVALPVFDTWASIIPLFFTRIALMFRPMFGHMEDEASVLSSSAAENTQIREGEKADSGTNAEE